MPKKLYENFKRPIILYPDDVKLNLYKKGNPNSYLASFASFLITHKNEPTAQRLLKKVFQIL